MYYIFAQLLIASKYIYRYLYRHDIVARINSVNDSGILENAGFLKSSIVKLQNYITNANIISIHREI